MTARKKPSPTLTTLTVVVLTVVAWWIFLGRDVVRDVDPATGNVTGPYEAPQVIACVLVLLGTLAGGAVVAVLTRVVERRRAVRSMSAQ